eukprot:4146200-Pyramimonas_sp.AAC.1
MPGRNYRRAPAPPTLRPKRKVKRALGARMRLVMLGPHPAKEMALHLVFGSLRTVAPRAGSVGLRPR